MASLNKMQLIGNLGADPDIRYMQDGTATVTVSVATTDTWKNKETGNKEEKTEWHRVVFFRGLAEIVGEYLKKGSQIYVEGKLRTRSWTDKEGIDRYTTEIVAQEMQMLGKKQDNNKVGNARHGDALPADEDDEYPF
ncbi:single-stranded DNA-binding protein [Xylella fastidiosa]|uniref:Single-stranded DNA-binding protein n=2 Tax=Xylella fastidiosa TaxID=2371 RepID=A0AAJ5R5E9_XYLFS|nr:single-stranded DNA-binding protein [Xylella fastidiosa]MRU28342.1 single-stranded DNA-binding protein [Xylella fastidiosa subsp. multiplex]MRU30732.1 single-stranded DNA-binding protein [Xylella fastidiosa subsp. multiplex]UIT53406.1 single-stranded DNA-binding protein [Xylella fastidiosa subsp. fastidiosa]WCF29598.1 single-stranded DNA-binding protein [Xylella fastidiosa subsp. fastidiosa]WLE28535.1 single-stranded DNA-binding protein [Xylella fastidiosa subsp. multiplex]